MKKLIKARNGSIMLGILKRNTNKFCSNEVGKFQTGKKPFGWTEKRLSLAIILINRPDLLILDEPTNHLDLEMIEWLKAICKRKHYVVYGDARPFFSERVCRNHELTTENSNTKEITPII
jgi:ABC-type Na+ transport system ATPase subunit NatA